MFGDVGVDAPDATKSMEFVRMEVAAVDVWPRGEFGAVLKRGDMGVSGTSVGDATSGGSACGWTMALGWILSTDEVSSCTVSSGA